MTYSDQNSITVNPEHVFCYITICKLQFGQTGLIVSRVFTISEFYLSLPQQKPIKKNKNK